MKTPNNDENVKKKVLSIRITEEMEKLFSMIAEEQGVSIAKYLRDAGIILAEMATDDKDLMALLGEKDKIKAAKTFHLLFQETKDTIVNSSQSVFDRLVNRIDRIEKLIEIFIYIYLFHTPEVKESLKQSAKQSAQERKKKVMAILSKSNGGTTDTHIDVQ